MRRILLILGLLVLAISPIAAQQREQHIIGGDTVTVSYTPIDQSSFQPRGKSRFSRWVDRYVLRDNSSLEYGTRFSLIGGPSYSSSTNLRLTLIGDLYYRTRAMSLDVQPSRLELSADASISGFYRVAAIGYNYLHRGEHRLQYHIETASLPTKIWGFDYTMSSGDSWGRYTSKRHFAWLRYSYAVAPRTYIGVYGDYRYLTATNCDDYASGLIREELDALSTAGFGVNVAYDTRDAVVNSSKGIYLGAEYIYRPELLSNLSQNLWQLTLQFNFYLSLWQGATLAYDLYGELRPNGTPWLLRSQLGNEHRMRGYYEGRYSGNNMITTQLELRQQIWDRLGCVVWGGCGTLFSTWDKFNSREILPTYGAGLRWRVRYNSNIRFDVGFGRNCYGFIFGINEAF